MGHSIIKISMFCVCILALNFGASASSTRYEAEMSSAPLAIDGTHRTSDFFALKSTDHSGEFADADLGWAFSNGKCIFAYNTWPAPGQLLEFNFAGTGVTASLLHYGNGAGLDWKILGKNDAVVANGHLLLNDTVAEPGDVLAPEGSLPAGLYKVVIDPTEGEGGAAVLLDYMEVQGDGLVRIEDSDARVQKTGTWAVSNSGMDGSYNGRFHSGGACSISSTQGDTIALTFTGTDLSVINAYRSDTLDGTVGGTFSWSIDGGAGGSGTVDTSQNRFSGQAFRDARVATILAKGLAAGQHTLTCTITSTGKDVRFDAFDIFGETPLTVTRFEPEMSTAPLAFNGVNRTSYFVALKSTDNSGEFTDADLSWSFSNGRCIFGYNTWPAPGQLIEFTFAGTGLKAGMLHYDNACDVDWTISGAGGATVSQGSTVLNDGVGLPGETIAAARSLPAGLYKVAFDPVEGQGGGVLLLDYLDVYDNAIQRIEETDTRVQKTGTWSTPHSSMDDAYAGRFHSGGTCTMSQTLGDALTLGFTGTDVAVVNTFRSDAIDGTLGGSFNWSIDGGAGGSGSIDTAQNRFPGVAIRDARVTTILAKGLPEGEHTLTCTISSAGKDVRFDAFDVYGGSPAAPTAAAHWTLY